MKIRVLVVALIGLLLATGLILVGCDFRLRECPGDGNCKITFTGTGSSYITHSINGCGENKGDNKCDIYKIISGSAGDYFERTCGSCGVK